MSSINSMIITVEIEELERRVHAALAKARELKATNPRIIEINQQISVLNEQRAIAQAAVDAAQNIEDAAGEYVPALTDATATAQGVVDAIDEQLRDLYGEQQGIEYECDAEAGVSDAFDAREKELNAIEARRRDPEYMKPETEIGVTRAARIAGVSVQAVRDVLRDDARRAAIFPGAYRTSDHPQRGEWRIPRAEVEAWKPRRVNQD